MCAAPSRPALMISNREEGGKGNEKEGVSTSLKEIAATATREWVFWSERGRRYDSTDGWGSSDLR